MREAIEWLREGYVNAGVAAKQREFSDETVSLGRAQTEMKRAARLLEALASPPETVEELRERLQKVTGLDDEHTSITAGEFPGNITVAWSEDCEFHEVQISAPTVRAAWFAIVGMMEVGQ